MHSQRDDLRAQSVVEHPQDGQQVYTQVESGGAFADWITKSDFEDAASDSTAVVLTQNSEPIFNWRTPGGLVATAFVAPRAFQEPRHGGNTRVHLRHRSAELTTQLGES